MKSQKTKSIILLSALFTATCMMTACGAKNADSNTNPTMSATTEAAETTAAEAGALATEVITLTPLAAAVDLADLSDCTVPASFAVSDFNWRGGNLTLQVYDTLCYDAVDVNRMGVGSTIDLGDSTVTVDSISTNESGDLTINEGEETELWLWPQDGGIYQIVSENDLRRMVCLGEAEVLLSEDFVLHDCTDNPGESVDISTDEVKTYLESLTDGRENFYDSDTTVTIENGEVTEITRVWIP